MKCVINCYLFSLLIALMGTEFISTADAEVIDSGDAILTTDKIYCTATIEDNFTDDCVLVVLTNEVSLSPNNYTAADFPEISCIGVSNLTQSATNRARAKLAGADLMQLCSDSSENTVFDDFYDIDLNAFQQVLCLKLSEAGKQNVLSAITLLQQRTDIFYAGPNYIYSTCATYPSDLLSDQQWAIDVIDLPEAWDFCTGANRSVTVGVIDSGINESHPDLMHQLDYVDSYNCMEAVASLVENVTDSTGHGTMVAGIIGARSNNNMGISGINWNIDIVSLQVNDGSGGSSAAIVLALQKAIDDGIPIVNISYGSILDTPVRAAVTVYNGLIICAAGNEQRNTDNEPVYPASYTHDYIISVGASTENDTIWSLSNYGENSVDLFAPGDSIISCYPVDWCLDGSHNTQTSIHYGNGYHIGSGTSLAAPYVTGVAALIYTKYPGITREEIKARILESVDIRTAYRNYCKSNGRLNAYKALCNHSYTAYYSSVDSTYHNSYCSCGMYKRAYHNFSEIGGLNICTECEYVSP